MKQRLRAVADQLDPLRLLEEIRAVQQHLSALAAGQTSHLAPRHPGHLDHFLKGLATAWQQGEVRATHFTAPRPSRDWRTRKDPFETVWPGVRAWLEAEPDRVGNELFARLQAEHPGRLPRWPAADVSAPDQGVAAAPRVTPCHDRGKNPALWRRCFPPSAAVRPEARSPSIRQHDRRRRAESPRMKLWGSRGPRCPRSARSATPASRSAFMHIAVNEESSFSPDSQRRPTQNTGCSASTSRTGRWLPSSPIIREPWSESAGGCL